jgi:hypothetical protein
VAICQVFPHASSTIPRRITVRHDRRLFQGTGAGCHGTPIRLVGIVDVHVQKCGLAARAPASLTMTIESPIVRMAGMSGR